MAKENNLSETLKETFLKKKGAFSNIFGQDNAKKEIMSALIMGRHIIIVGPPGVGKTTIAKSIAKLLPEETVNDCEYNCYPGSPICPNCQARIAQKEKIPTKKIEGEKRFVRVQGSPDLTVEDLLGDIDPIKAMKFGPLSIEAFTPGKIFKANNGVLFFDEVNRCSEKLQNALLQVLQEGRATIGSYDIDLPANFIFIGTMNPEDTSTEKLSEVFLDRFDIVRMTYPETLATEVKIVIDNGRSIQGVNFPEKLLQFSVLFVRLLRESDKLVKHPGVRASIGLYERAQANAYLSQRKEVAYHDIESAILSVISHRIELKPSYRYLESAEDFIRKEFSDFVKNNPELEEHTGDDP